MSAIKSLIDAGIAAQSAALLAENYKAVKPSFNSKKIKARDGARNIIGLGVKNIIGINLLKAQADIAGGLK